jgi:hypothetical protein
MWEEMYVDIPHRKNVVRRKRPKIWRTNISFLLHDNAPAHGPVLVKAFYAKNMPTLELPPNSHGLAPAGFYLLPQLQSALQGWLFCYATNITKNAKKGLTSLSENGFQKGFHHFYSCWQTCIAAPGGYFEENAA